MSNVHGLFSNRNDDSSDDDKDDGNNRYVGGIGDRGGGRCVRNLYEQTVFVQAEIMNRVDILPACNGWREKTIFA